MARLGMGSAMGIELFIQEPQNWFFKKRTKGKIEGDEFLLRVLVWRI